MGLQALLEQQQITRNQLSKISGVPKTTITDICSGRSAIERCSARTVQQLAKALGCTMEVIMETASAYDSVTGFPKNKSYFEVDLPPFLTKSIVAMKKGQAKLDRGEEYYDWDCDFSDLQSSINVAEVENIITTEQAWYLREKYLGMERI